MAKWQRLRIGVLVCGLVLLVLGAKLSLIDSAGNSLPGADEIATTGLDTVLPWASNGGTIAWSDVFRPRPDGPAAVERLLTLGILASDGQWDSYIAQVINAALHALLLPLLLFWARPCLPRGLFGVVALLTTAAWCLPFTWSATLDGADISNTLLIWFAALQLRGVLNARPGRLAWLGGHLCGLLALGTTGAGVAGSVAVALVLIRDAAAQRRLDRLGAASLVLSLSWIALGLSGGLIHLGSAGQLVATVVWPWHGWLPFALVAAFPLGGLIFNLGQQTRAAGTDRWLLGVAIWFVVAGAAPTSGMNVAIAGLWLHAVALHRLPLAPQGRTWLLGLWAAGAAYALCVVLPGRTQESLAVRQAEWARRESSVRAFLTAPESTPPPEPTAFWSNAAVRAVMPAAVRPPVAFAPAPADALNGLPPAPYPVIAVSPATAQNHPWIWESPHQAASTLPVLRFRISGAFGDQEAPLRMRVAGATWSADVLPDGSARGRWKTINVVRPPGEWWIELIDSDSAENFALTAPVELGWLSWSTEKWLKYHSWFVAGGAALLLGGGLAAWPLRSAKSTSLPLD